MKVKKGDAGYIKTHKKNVIIKCIIMFGMSLTVFIFGIIQTKSRLNLLTVLAVLGCLPASKALVEVIMILPHKTISQDREKEIKAVATSMITIFDTVFTSEKKIMPVESIVIRKHTICGYTSKEKIATQVIEEHLKHYLTSNKISGVSVKIFHDYQAFLNRAKEMNNIDESGEYDEYIRCILLNLSI